MSLDDSSSSSARFPSSAKGRVSASSRKIRSPSGHSPHRNGRKEGSSVSASSPPGRMTENVSPATLKNIRFSSEVSYYQSYRNPERLLAGVGVGEAAVFPEGEEGTQFPFPPCLGSLALGAAVLSEVPSLQHDAQQFGRGVCIRIRIRKFGAMQPEVFRQECMELRAPPEQAGPPVNGFQIPGE